MISGERLQDQWSSGSIWDTSDHFSETAQPICLFYPFDRFIFLFQNRTLHFQTRKQHGIITYRLIKSANVGHIYLMVLSRSFTDHHLMCGGWLNFEFSKRGKHLGWTIKTICKKQSRGMLKRIPLDPRFK